jgi:hypothetical protein
VAFGHGPFLPVHQHVSGDVGLVGSAVDCRDMTFGKWAKVKADMDRTFELAGRCKGLIFAAGN